METDRKVVIVGAGAVGATFAYTLMRTGLAGEIVLVDLDRERAEGEALDMNHGLFFVPPVKVRAGGYDDCRNAAVVVVTAGASQKPGETRLDLTGRNARIVRSVLDAVLERTRDAVIVMVTNPVDVLTHLAVEHADLPPGRVLGSGTVLDSARFRFLISRRFRVDPRNVHAYIAGEHGDSEVALWSMVHIGGIHLDAFCRSCPGGAPDLDRDAVLKRVRDSAYHVVESKGATYYAVSLALERIVAAILRDENSVLTVSVPVEDFHGMEGISMSLPCIVNRTGAAQVVHPDLPPDEIEALRHSASVLAKAIGEAGGAV